MVLTLLGTLVATCGVIVVTVRILSRKAVGELQGNPLPTVAPPLNTLVSDEVIRMLSQRLSALEGTLPALQQMLDGYGGMATRLAALEGRLPDLADAFDKYTHNIVSQEKRTRERERTETKKLTVAEAAAQAGMAADPAAVAAAVAGPPANPLPVRMPGVLGGNGIRSR